MAILESILSVFTLVGDWLQQAFIRLMRVFYVSGEGLTFLGVLAVASLAFSVVFLIIGLIQRFLHFRG